MKNKIAILFLALSLFLSCAPDADPVTIEINKTINDNEVSQEEWTQLISFIESSEEAKSSYPRLLIEGKVNERELKKMIKQKHKKKPNRTKAELVFSLSQEEELINPSVNVFLENSGSMYGYMVGHTGFEAAVMGFLSDIDYHYNHNINNYFINNDTFPSHRDIELFINELEPKNMQKMGNTGSSNLNDIFKQILKQTDKTEVSVFISDCIYSIDGKNTEELLYVEENATKTAFLNKKDFPLTTIVVKLTSNFNGQYWYENKENKKEKSVKLDQKRPYYIWIMGSELAMNHFYNKIPYKKLKELKGFQNIFVMAGVQKEKKPYYTILQTTGKKGRFKIGREGSNQDYVHSIEEITIETRNNSSRERK